MPTPHAPILEYARDHLAPYLKVRRVEFFELPKTMSGKIRRVELRRREEDAHAAGTPIETEYRYEDLVDAPHAVLRRRADRYADPRRDHRRQLRPHRGDPPRMSRLWSTSPRTGAGRTPNWTPKIDVVARGLMALGIEKGDRVGIWAPNCAEWTIVQYATAKIGAILVNINPAYRTHELGYVLNQSGCAHADLRDVVQDLGLCEHGRARSAPKRPR